MKKIIALLLILAAFTVARGQLTVAGNSTVQSFTPFVLDMQFQIPSKPGCNRVRTVLSFSTTTASVLGEYVNLTGATFQLDPLQTLFPSVPLDFSNANKSVSSQTVNGQPGVTTNIQFNLNTDIGVLCNNTALQFICKVYFYPAGSTTPCDSVTSNTATVTITAQNQWPLTLGVVTNPSALCRGNNIIYKIISDHPDNRTGVLNLYDPFISFTLPVNATVVQVMNAGFSQIIPHTTVVNGAVKTITFDADPFSPYNYTLSLNSTDFWLYHVIVRYECADFQEGYEPGTSALLSAKDRCGNPVSTPPSANSFKLGCSNCGGTGTPVIRKSIGESFGQFCREACSDNQYYIEFDNSNFATIYASLTLGDNIPQEIDVTSVFTEVFGSPVTISYTTSTNPGTQTYTVNSTGTVTAADLGCNPPCRITSLRWIYEPFPAFSNVKNRIKFRLNNMAQVGQPVVNTAFAQSNSPALNVSVNLPYTVTECQARYNLRKRIVPQGGSNCVQQFSYSPGEEVTFRLIMYNQGGAPGNNITINDVLNNVFTFQPGSVRYYYGPNDCPLVNDPLWQSSYQFPGSGQVTAGINGQALSFSNVNLPNCSYTRFIIEFKVKIRDLTLPGTYCNGFNATGANIYTGYNNNISDSACAVVNSFFKLAANMKVACRGNNNFTDSLKVKQGDLITYRVEMKNEGNVNLSEPRIFNVRPQPGDNNSTCTPASRGSQFTVSYTGATSANFTNELYSSSNCNGIICTGGTVCTGNATFASLQSLGAKGNTSVVITPGASAFYFIDAIAGNGAIGQPAFNDALVNARRADLGIFTPGTPATPCRVILSNTGCGDTLCACGSWQYTRWEYINNGNWVSAYFKCGDSLKPVLKPGNTHPFYFRYNCNDTSCHAQYSVTSDLPATAYTAGIDAFGQFTVRYTASDKHCGWHYFRVTPRCGDTDCEPCIVYFQVDCPPPSCGEIVKDSILCTDKGPVYSFCVKNNSNFAAYLIKIKIPAGVNPVNITPAGGATYAGNSGGYYSFLYPGGLAPNDILCTFSFMLAQPYYSGQQICLGLALHKETQPPFITCCEDSTYKKCFIVPDCPDPCLDMVRPSIDCRLTPKGYMYNFNFSIINNSTTEADSLELQYINPVTGAITDLCNWRLIPPVSANGGTGGVYSCTLPFSPAPGSLHCFRVIKYDLHWLGGVWCINDSCISEMVCVRAPDCRREEEGGGGELRHAPVTAKPVTVANADEAAGYMLLPNPASRQVTITGKGTAAKLQQVTLSTVSGRIIGSYRPGGRQPFTIDISGLPAGLYIITVNNQSSFKLLKN